MSTDSKTRVVTTYRLREMKSRGEKISMLTAYDYSMARIVDAAGVDVVLVGDSAANVMAGFETTVPMTLDHMIYHARSVTRAVKRALVVVDMPFGTYQGLSLIHIFRFRGSRRQNILQRRTLRTGDHLPRLVQGQSKGVFRADRRPGPDGRDQYEKI